MDIYRIIPVSSDEGADEFKEGFFFEDKETAEIVMAALDAITPEDFPKIEWKCDVIELLSREQALLDLPGHTDMNTLLLVIPEDCKQLCESGEELKEGYFVVMHANGHNLFVSKTMSQGERQIFPIYPTKENPLRNWKVKNYETKP